MGELTVIWWRDIPAQVIARAAGGQSARRPLDDRFQVAIDAAAMAEGLIGSDAYLEEWRRESRSCGDGVAVEVADEVDRLEASYDADALAALVRSGGKATG